MKDPKNNMSTPADLSAGYSQSVDLLKESSTADGFVASKNSISNYSRIWTRDASITGLAALLSADKDLIDTFRRSICILFDHQHPTGFMPSNVQPASGQASYGGTVGRTDNVCWAPIGLLSYCLFCEDMRLAEKYYPAVQKCFSLLEAWEYNGKGLVYTPQSGDWADEYIQHGYILYDQLLRIWALELAAEVYKHQPYREKALMIREMIRTNFWKNDSAEELYAPNMNHQLKNLSADFWFMGFNPSRIYPQFDLQANSLALLLDMGTAAQQQKVLDFLSTFIGKQKNMLPSFFPSLVEGDVLYEDLKNNYAYEFRNYAHEFHNGGLWPVWNGFLAAALMQKGRAGDARMLTDFIAEANFKDSNDGAWGFYENLHGQTLAPIGVQHCTWSAAGQIIATHYLQGKQLIFFNSEK